MGRRGNQAGQAAGLAGRGLGLAAERANLGRKGGKAGEEVRLAAAGRAWGAHGWEGLEGDGEQVAACAVFEGVAVVFKARGLRLSAFGPIVGGGAQELAFLVGFVVALFLKPA